MCLKKSIVAALALFAATVAEAKVVFTRDAASVVVQNNDAPFDKAFFVLDGKALALVVPENAGAGLASGAKVFINSIDMGETPAAYGAFAADRIVLERMSDGCKWVSQPAAVDVADRIVSTSGGSVPRIVYSFGVIKTTPGERFRLSFLDKSDAVMNKVRYAAAEIDDGVRIFENLEFTAPNGKSYCPVYSLRMSTMTDTPKFPGTAVADAEKKAPPRRKAPEHPVSLSIFSHEKVVDSDGGGVSFGGISFGRDVKPRSASYRYKGMVSQEVPAGHKTRVIVEAYFVVHADANGGRDRIFKSRTVGCYSFGGSNLKSQVFEFASPEFDEPTGNGTGSKYAGVIVRALEGGLVGKVVTIPHNPTWARIAQKDIVAFDYD